MAFCGIASIAFPLFRIESLNLVLSFARESDPLVFRITDASVDLNGSKPPPQQDPGWAAHEPRVYVPVSELYIPG